MRLTPTHTGLVLLVVFVLLLTYEGLTLNFGQNATISEVVWALSLSTPLVPFLAGVLNGHFFFPKGSCVHCGKRPWAK